MNKEYETKALALATKVASKLNLNVEEVSWVNESNNYILRIIASKDEGYFDIDDCTRLNEAISLELDKEDFIKEEYMLEVSSEGAEKVLKSEEEIIKNINEYIHIDLNNPIEILKNIRIHDIEGTLKEVNNDNVVLNVNLKGRMKDITIEKNNIKLIRKAIKF